MQKEHELSALLIETISWEGDQEEAGAKPARL
jgi:hypothetical protein